MNTEKNWNKIKNLICILLGLAAFAMYVLAMHDRMTAQGIGLYMALRFQSAQKSVFDLSVDFARLLVFVILMLLPCIFLKRLKIQSLFRLFCAWIGLIPFVDASAMIHILFDAGSITPQQMTLTDRFWYGTGQVFQIFQCWIPLIFMLLLCRQMANDSSEDSWRQTQKIQLPRKVLWSFLVVQAVMVVLLFLLPAFGEIWCLVLFYLLLVESFTLWEDLCERNPRWNTLSLWLFGLFWIRGIYKMAEILSTSKING